MSLAQFIKQQDTFLQVIDKFVLSVLNSRKRSIGRKLLLTNFWPWYQSHYSWKLSYENVLNIAYDTQKLWSFSLVNEFAEFDKELQRLLSPSKLQTLPSFTIIYYLLALPRLLYAIQWKHSYTLMKQFLKLVQWFLSLSITSKYFLFIVQIER